MALFSSDEGDAYLYAVASREAQKERPSLSLSSEVKPKPFSRVKLIVRMPSHISAAVFEPATIVKAPGEAIAQSGRHLNSGTLANTGYPP